VTGAPGDAGPPGSDKIGRVRILWFLLAAAIVAGAGGCGDASAAGEADRFTQGGVSMEPTVKAGQVISTRAVEGRYTPKRGDIVLFHDEGWYGDDPTKVLLKRVIAVGGETIACCDPAGKVTVDGTPLDEPYVAQDSPLDVSPSPQFCGPRRFGPVAVATGTVFVMGDNRANSNDSRCAGPIPATSIFAVMVS
jgi:signal peptidase I